MVDFRIDYPEGRNFFLDQGAGDMIPDQNLEQAIADLSAERADYVAKIEELDITIKTLSRRLSGNRNDPSYPSVVIHNREFAGVGIAEAAVTMIKRAHRPLHVKEIAEGLRVGGYEFRTHNPMGSIAPVLYEAARAKRHGVINMGKNTYSVVEITK